MEKHIIKWSYWLGISSVALAFLARAVNILGPDSLHFATKGNPVGYHSFLDGAVLFFLTTIATASYSWFNSQSRRS
jgi:hypothetical protein